MCILPPYSPYGEQFGETPKLKKHKWCETIDDVLDLLLDQEGLEVDPIDRLEADTPLHKAVRFVNGLSRSEWEAGSSIVELLLDAGADPRCFLLICSLLSVPYLWSSGANPKGNNSIRNKAKLKAQELVDPRNTALRNILQKAEFTIMAGDDVVDEDDNGATGSASDSD